MLAEYLLSFMVEFCFVLYIFGPIYRHVNHVLIKIKSKFSFLFLKELFELIGYFVVFIKDLSIG